MTSLDWVNLANVLFFLGAGVGTISFWIWREQVKDAKLRRKR